MRALHLARSLRRSRARAGARGLTLVEVLVVVVLVSLLMVGVVAGTNQLPSSRLKRSATMIASAVKVAYARATATSKHVRVVFDFDTNRLWIEESDIPMLVQSKDQTGTGGAQPLTDAEKTAVAEGERILKGVEIAKPAFKPVDEQAIADIEKGSGEVGRPLQRGITFREVQAAHDASARTSGRAYLYFWPGGLTERAVVQIRIGTSDEANDTMSLEVAPLTGKVTVKRGPQALQQPEDERAASEREDTGP